jgi:DNA-binding NarL/FixJ family response regulator
MHTPSLHNILPSGLVENDSCVREALFTIIASAREMMLAQDTSNAECALTTNTDTWPSIVLMDINLTGASGIDRVRELSHRYPTVQLMMYSMREDDHRAFDAPKASAKGQRLKGAKPLEILNALRDLLQGKGPMGTPIPRRLVAHSTPAQAGEHLSEANLTDRDREILELLAEGLLYKEISLRIGISEAAIKQHIHRMYAKLHVQNRTEAVNKYFGR